MKKPKSLALAEKGLTGEQLSGLLSTLITDIFNGSITSQQGNSISNAIGNLQRTHKARLFDGAKWRLWDSATNAVPADFLKPIKAGKK